MSAGPTPGVSVLVPVYNGARTIEELTRRVDAAFGAELPGLDWELIFVVDGSPDDSWSVVEGLMTANHHVVGIELFRNFGQHNALLAGIRHARFDTIVTMDDDLQHRPETIPTLLAGLGEQIDLVYGTSPVEEHGWWRSAASRLTKSLMSVTLGTGMARDAGAYRAFRTSLRDGFTEVDDTYVSIDVLLSWVTNRYVTVSTPMDQRTIGSSGYTMSRLINHAINMVTGYSSKPLRLVAWMGFTLALGGLAALVFVLGRYAISGSAVPGFVFLASLVSVLTGAQLFGMGVIGEYLGRMNFRSMQRPTYVIRQTRLGGGSPETPEAPAREFGPQP